MKHFACTTFVLLLSVGCSLAEDVPFVELKGHTAWAHSAVFSPDGKKMVAAGKGHTVIIWDAETGKELQRLQLDPNSRADVGGYFISLISYDPKVSSITFSPDGKRIATASNDGCVRVWTLE